MYERILVPIDGSAPAASGLDEAIKVAKLTGATVRLLHVLDQFVFATGFETGATYMKDVLPKMRKSGDQLVGAARARVIAAGVPVDTLVCECFARRTSDIVLEQAEAWKADLIVLGTHGRRGMSRAMLGSDAEQVVRGASIPVLLVRAAEAAENRAPGEKPAAVHAAA